jgi:hypothetical protein
MRLPVATDVEDLMNEHTAVGIADRLERARAVAVTLSVATDELNAKLTEAEKQFAALKLGVAEEIDLAEPGDTDELATSRLSFQKEGAAWKFVIRAELGARRSETRLLQASRHVRIRAAACLEPLLEKLIRKAEAQHGAVLEAVQRVAELNEQLGTGQGAGDDELA